MNYVVKIKYEDTLRRLTYHGNRPYGEQVGDKLTFAKLEAKIRDLFKLPASAPIRVTYKDNDNDVITMGDDQDLEDACVLQGLNPLRLHVTLVEVKRVGTAEGHNEYRSSCLAASNKEGGSNLKDVMKPVIDHVQQLLNVPATSPRQLTELVDSVVHKVTYHIDSALKQVDLPSHVTAGVSSSSGGLTVPATSQNHPVCSPSQHPLSLHSTPIPAGFPVGIGHNTPIPVGNPIPTPVPALRTVSDGVPVHRNVSDSKASEAGNACRVFHSGVQCDSCGMNPIVGPRFKAIKKDDYDLCVSCYKELGNASDYHRIDRPLFRPRHLRCPALNPNFHAGRVGLSLRGSYGARPEHLRQPVHQTTGFGKLDARFVQDVTIFDGTELAPLTSFTKIWRLRNSGTLAWPVDTKLVHVGGDELGNVIHVPLELPETGLAPGDEVEVSVDLVAPEKPGRYVSHWRLASPAGPKFGHRVWVLIQVLSRQRDEDALPSEISSPSPFATLNKEETGSQETASTGSKSTDSDNRAEKGTQGVQNGHIFLSEDYPTERSPLFTDPEVRLTEEGPPESPSELMTTVAVDGESHVQACGEGVTSMNAGSLQSDLISKDNERLRYVEFTSEEEIMNQAVVGGGSPSSQKNESVASEMSVEDVSAFVNSEVGWFSLVDMPQLVSSSSSGITASTASVEVDPASSLATRNSPRELTPADVPRKGDTDEDGALDDKRLKSLTLCEKLEGMGFNDRKLNLELLEKNNMDLRRTLDEYLFAATEWDPILEELEEMGFYDIEMNRRLMFKNNGSVKRVVKELVQMYKEPVGAAKDKGKGKEVQA